MTGLTCRSCHADGSASGESAPAPSGDVCVDCHRPEYRAIPEWWSAGVGDRLTLVDRYVTLAEADAARLPEGDPVRAALSTARERLEWVRAGWGVHNLPLAHQIFEEALAAGAAVYVAIGANAPAAPDMGRPPRSGFCSGCHYQVGQLGLSEDMPEDFHQEVIGN
jgi:hypothetical protein